MKYLLYIVRSFQSGFFRTPDLKRIQFILLFLLSGSVLLMADHKGEPQKDCINPPGPAEITTPGGGPCYIDGLFLDANPVYVGTGVWTIVSGPGFLYDETLPNAFITDLENGVTTVVRWTVSNEDCDDAVAEISITPYIPAPVIAADLPVCMGTNLIMTVSGNDLINATWYDNTDAIIGSGYSVTVPISDFSQSGIYSVEVEDSHGCLAYAYKGIEILYADIADAGPDVMLCEDNYYQMNAESAPASTGSWTVLSGYGEIDDISDPNTNVWNIAAGINLFVWTVTPNDGCPATSDTVQITVGSGYPNLSSNSPVCEGGNLTLSVNNASDYLTFAWEDNNGNPLGNTSTVVIPNAVQSNAGSYSITVTDQYNCIITGHTGVEILPVDIANAGPDQLLCEEDYTNLAATDPINGTGQWTLLSGSGNIEDVTDPNTYVSGLGIGQNMIVWTVTSNYGCEAVADTVVIKVGAGYPNLSSNSPVCEGSDIILTVNNASDYLTFAWEDNNGNPLGNTSTVVIPNAVQSNAGSYSIPITAHDPELDSRAPAGRV